MVPKRPHEVKSKPTFSGFSSAILRKEKLEKSQDIETSVEQHQAQVKVTVPFTFLFSLFLNKYVASWGLIHEMLPVGKIMHDKLITLLSVIFEP